MTGTEVTKCFEDRLQDLIADSGKDIKTLAAEIGISSGALSKYQNDKSEAGITALYKIARYFGVTTDYLVGISDNKTSGNYHIGKRLGLTDEAIKELEAITGPGGEGIGIFYDPRHKFIIALERYPQIRERAAGYSPCFPLVFFSHGYTMIGRTGKLGSVGADCGYWQEYRQSSPCM